MKLVFLFLLVILTSACQADEKVKNDCVFTHENLNLSTPKGLDLDQAFWQKDLDGSEKIDRITMLFKDGSVAVIEHKYCSMYNFEVAYYTDNQAKFSDTKKLNATLKNLYSLSAIQDKSLDVAINTMTNRLQEKGYSEEQAIGTGYDSSTEKNQKVEFSLSYQPLDDSSIHKAALFIYMGVGGED